MVFARGFELYVHIPHSQNGASLVDTAPVLVEIGEKHAPHSLAVDGFRKVQIEQGIVVGIDVSV